MWERRDDHDQDYGEPPWRPEPMESKLTDQQFRSVITHLRIIIAILGFVAGILVALAWAYCEGTELRGLCGRAIRTTNSWALRGNKKWFRNAPAPNASSLGR